MFKTSFSFLLVPLAVFGLVALTPRTVSAQSQEVPYWAALQWNEVNMRTGPSGDYPIKWKYWRKGMPVKVLRRRESWRLVEDPEGEQGWIDSTQLTATRGVIVIGDGLVDLRETMDPNSQLRWRAEPGVVAALLGCRDNMCEINVAGRVGWAEKSRLWGAGEP